MSENLTSSLPVFDRRLLQVVQKIVPLAERKEWSRAWQAELWHLHYRSRMRQQPGVRVMIDFSIGLSRDALWLRTENWRRTFTGTATLCLCSLWGLIVIASFLVFAPDLGWHSLPFFLCQQFDRSLLAAPLVVFVAFASTSNRHIQHTSKIKGQFWMRRQAFFFVKVAQVLLLAYLFSIDICQPIHRLFPVTADLFQIFCFVLFSLLGLRWALLDQEQRCKQCLHSLGAPSRVGRPSRNLLEWNGTELNCIRGHGLLSVPEMETSWCQSSQWVVLEPDW